MQPIAARVPDADYERIQHFISTSPWDWEGTQSRLIDVMREELSAPDGVLIVDDLPLLKQGRKSPGVAHQWCGLTGSVANCQVLVDAY